MNRVLQAAGRVIRRESDCGVIVLMDDRYATPQYKSLFPDHWLHAKSATNAAELANIVSDFWNKYGQE
jgi:Rad3-related DNA helicase